MGTEAIKALVEVFDGLGADATFIASILIGYLFARTLLFVGLLTFLIVRITGMIVKGISQLSLSKRLQHDLGYAGELVTREREHILRVWKKGLAIEKGH